MSSCIKQLNRELCAALGITDLSNVTRVTVEITPSRLPVVTVHRVLRDPATLVLQRCQLVPIEAEGGVDATAG